MNDLDDRINSAVEAADDAFWSVIAERFPEATTGDLAPHVSIALAKAMTDAVTRWVEDNTNLAEDNQ